MKNAYIFGASGHANVIASIIHKRFDAIRFVDLSPSKGVIINEDEFFEDIEKYQNDKIYLGIGSNEIRKKIYKRLQKLNINPANCIAENTFIAHDAELGNGVTICPGSVVGTNAKIGNNTIINTLSSVDHDCILGDHSQVTAGVTFGGNVTVGENCFFGVKSAVIPSITIGDNSVVMAGSIVYKDVPENVMVGGNPAKVMKQFKK